MGNGVGGIRGIGKWETICDGFYDSFKREKYLNAAGRANATNFVAQSSVRIMTEIFVRKERERNQSINHTILPCSYQNLPGTRESLRDIICKP
jgi:hypothetical protein